MNLEQFKQHYSNFGIYDLIIIACSTEGCIIKEQLEKYSAIKNIQRHGNKFLCRSCCYTDEGKGKIAKATSYPRSEETKKKMSDAKKAYFQTEKGLENKKNLSKLTSEGHSKNKYENAKRQGWFPSSKTGKWVFYGSSYELRLCWLLDQDDTVITYETQISYTWEDRGRCLDFFVEYNNGVKKAIEVKPENRLNEESVILQLSDSKNNAITNKWEFEVYTEKNFNMSYMEIRKWADKHRESLTGIDYTERREESNRKKAKKHYDEKIATDTVEVYCEYCKETHYPLRLTHDKNISRNGRYICEREGGFIAGSLPKPHLIKENPYAAEGKKQCGNSECKEILLFECFSTDPSRRDGYCSWCKKCRAEKNKKTYQQKIAKKLLNDDKNVNSY